MTNKYKPPAPVAETGLTRAGLEAAAKEIREIAEEDERVSRMIELKPTRWEYHCPKCNERNVVNFYDRQMTTVTCPHCQAVLIVIDY